MQTDFALEATTLLHLRERLYKYFLRAGSYFGTKISGAGWCQRLKKWCQRWCQNTLAPLAPSTSYSVCIPKNKLLLVQYLREKTLVLAPSGTKSKSKILAPTHTDRARGWCQNLLGSPYRIFLLFGFTCVLTSLVLRKTPDAQRSCVDDLDATTHSTATRTAGTQTQGQLTSCPRRQSRLAACTLCRRTRVAVDTRREVSAGDAW